MFSMQCFPTLSLKGHSLLEAIPTGPTLPQHWTFGIHFFPSTTKSLYFCWASFTFSTGHSFLCVMVTSLMTIVPSRSFLQCLHSPHCLLDKASVLCCQSGRGYILNSCCCSFCIHLVTCPSEFFNYSSQGNAAWSILISIRASTCENGLRIQQCQQFFSGDVVVPLGFD